MIADSKADGTGRTLLPSRSSTLQRAGSSLRDAGPGIGVLLPLFLVWLWFEHGRPASPMRIPMLISFVLFSGWLLVLEKKWNTYVVGMLGFCVVMTLSALFSRNVYSAVWTTYGMTVVVAFVMVPLVAIVDSIRKMRVLMNGFVVVFVYVALFAVSSGGFGPSGSFGGQDENYMGTAMSIAFPIAYFSMLESRRPLARLLFGGSAALFLAAAVAGRSRGGNVAMAVSLAYCLAWTPRKAIAIAMCALLLPLVLVVAPPGFWDEMATVTDTTEETADLRLELWAVAVRMFVANPLLGVGPGNYRWNIGTYQTAEQFAKFGRQLFAVTHSLYFELIAELGLAGSLLVGALLFRAFRDLWGIYVRGRRRRRNAGLDGDGVDGQRRAEDVRTVECYGRALAGALLGCLAGAAFVSMLYFSYLWMLLAMTGALAALAGELEGETAPPRGANLRRWKDGAQPSGVTR